MDVRRRPTFAVALGLVTALLACVFNGAADQATPGGNLATVTPGGRASVSLLTPTLTLLNPVGQAATPISQLATATAAAATAIAGTATALAPTATIPGVFTAPAVCPQPGSPSLPADPPAFSRYAETIAAYLSAGGAPTILEARLRSWGALPDYGGRVLTDRDFTGDGVPEVLVVALDPANSAFPYPGDIFVFGCEDAGYRLLYQLGSIRDRSFPILHAADDINGDLLNDIVFVTQKCLPDQVCVTDLVILEWSLALDNLISLLAEPVTAAAAQVALVDPDGDRVRDVVITSGADTSPEAGPQRTITTTLRWLNGQYIVAEVLPAEAQYRVHVIHEADAAFDAEDYVAALEGYQRAIDDDELLSWQYPGEREELAAYAAFRVMLAYAAQGDLANAQRTRDELLAAYEVVLPTPLPATPVVRIPGAGFADMARLFWGEFVITRDLDSGCRVVTAYARLTPAAYEVLNSFGTANPVYAPEDVCPFGGG